MNDASHTAFSPTTDRPFTPATSRRTLSWRPARRLLDRLLGNGQPDITKAAFERWQIAPRSCIEVRSAKVLPGQLERISGAEVGTVKEAMRHFKGGFDVIAAPTMGYCIRDVLLHNGVLHARGAIRRLRPGTRFAPLAFAPHEMGRLALYESGPGNLRFGSWLGDDCLTYRLAEDAGVPFTTALSSTGKFGRHMFEYESALGMLPARAAAIHCNELVLFDDETDNEHKRARADEMRWRLVRRPVERHPGVFLLQERANRAGPHALLNELNIAEHLAVRHGFRVLDPSRVDIAQIARACGGAEVIAGVEGDHLVHGLLMMPADARALVIQPQTGVNSTLKRLTDRQGQDYALVVAKGANNGFIADIDDVERTLDLV
ncbi:uncharacterized protein DUF563 [Novosphingobium sp. PhB165]|uniref:glycosyltransferase 61 family protein n=1 Tax=Novosphingobium sp. PhB165 TaxID=2485105 RepID=UPI0010EAAC93|nr:glycosyltransferase 61 family protein [Novosphingobium sp. PhB165]TCM20830.1 uncharacterized protein DUF563 [Novosphingobium sp. PhB165]